MDPGIFKPTQVPEQSQLNEKPFPTIYTPTKPINYIQLQHYF